MFITMDWNVENLCIVQSLLHSWSDGMIIIFRFNNGDGCDFIVIQNVIGAFAFTPLGTIALHVDPSISECYLFPQLGSNNPSCSLNSRDNVLVQISFSERSFFDCIQSDKKWALEIAKNCKVEYLTIGIEKQMEYSIALILDILKFAAKFDYGQ